MSIVNTAVSFLFSLTTGLFAGLTALAAAAAIPFIVVGVGLGIYISPANIIPPLPQSVSSRRKALLVGIIPLLGVFWAARLVIRYGILILEELFYTPSRVTDIDRLKTKSRVVFDGVVSGGPTATAPVSQDEGVLVNWEVEEKQIGGWTTVASGVRSEEFTMTNQDVETPESGDLELSVRPADDVDYMVGGSAWSSATASTPDEFSPHIQQFLSAAAPDVESGVRVSEYVLRPGDDIVVYSEYKESSMGGHWERVLRDPRSDALHMVIGHDESAVRYRTWHRLIGAFMWAAILLTGNFASMWVVLKLLPLLT